MENFEALWKNRAVTKYKLEYFLREFAPNINETQLRKIMKNKKLDIASYIYNDKYLRDKLKDIKLSYFEAIQTPSRTMNLKSLGLQKSITEDEKKKFNDPDYDLNDPFEGLEPLGSYLNKDGTQRQQIKLQQHQIKFLEGFFYGNLKGGIVFHGVGTGKTYSAVASMRFYMQLYPKNKIVFITPTAVIFNMIKALLDYGIDVRNPKISYFTYDKFYRTKIDLTDTLVIIDEAHNYRTYAYYTDVKDFDGTVKEELHGSKRSGDAMIKLQKAHKCLYLTGTPFVNTPYDIENLLAMSEGRFSNSQNVFYSIASRSDVRYDYFKFRISHYENSMDDKNFPERREIYIPIALSRKKYGNIISSGTQVELDEDYHGEDTTNKNPFYIRSRQNSSVIDGQKTNYIMKDILDNPNKKYVIYSSFHAFGIKQIIDKLKKKKIEYCMITGRESKTEKEDAKTQYNKFGLVGKDYIDKTCRIIIISKAGAEGVDLVGTNTIYVLDNVWNEATYEQIVARAIRYKSHTHLPAKEQYVNVKRILLVFEDEEEYFKDINKGTFNFEELKEKILLVKALMAEKKELQKYNQTIKGINKDTTNAKEKSKLTRNKNLEKKKLEIYEKHKDTLTTILSNDTGFDFKEEELGKRGTKERSDAYKKKLFDKDKDTYVRNALEQLIEEPPSNDLRLLINEKVKQNLIDKMVLILSKIPTIEKTVADLEETKELYDTIVKRKLKGKQLINFLRSELTKLPLNTLKKIDTKNIKNNLNDYIEKLEKRKK